MQHGLGLADQFQPVIAAQLRKRLVAVEDFAGRGIDKNNSLGGFLKELAIASFTRAQCFGGLFASGDVAGDADGSHDLVAIAAEGGLDRIKPGEAAIGAVHDLVTMQRRA